MDKADLLGEYGRPKALTLSQWTQFICACGNVASTILDKQYDLSPDDFKELVDNMETVATLSRLAGFGSDWAAEVTQTLCGVLDSVFEHGVKVTPSEKFIEDRKFLSGDYEFKLSSGWIVEVFFDCGDWDYINKMTSPNGQSWNFEALPSGVRNWQAGSGDAWEMWGIE